MKAEDVTTRRAASIKAAYLASIVESSDDMIVSYSLNGTFLSWNRGAQKLLGYTAAEAVGRQASLIVPPERMAGFEKKLRIVKAGGRVPSFETDRIHKAGFRVPVELTLSPVMEGDRVFAITAIGRDISERKRAEAKVRESEERFRTILENSLDVAYRRNLQTDDYDYISPVIERLTGYTAEEMNSKALNMPLKHVHPADIRHVKRAFKKALTTGKPCPRLEYRFQCKDGSYRWLAEAFRVLRDESGRPSHVIGTVRDVSDRRQIEEALRESQRFARATVEALPAQIAVLDESGSIIDVNRAWRRFARENGGTDATTDGGVNYLDVCENVHGLELKDAKRFAEGIRAVLQGRKRAFSMEYPCHSPAEKRWFTGYVTPFAGFGDRRVVVAHVNITAVKLAEEKFRAVLESAPDAMVIVDQSGTIRMANEQTERLFGYTRTELIGRTVEMLLPAGFRRMHVVERKGYTAAPSSRPMGIAAMTLSGRRKDGSEFPVEVNLSPLQTGTETLVCSVVRDITVRKKTEEEIRALNTELEARVAARTAALQSSNEALRQAIEDRRRLEGEIIGISESERHRIAQDLHDDLGQQIAGVWFMSLSLQKNLETKSAPEAGSAARIAGILGKALELTRSLARGLHPVTSEPGGLVAALNELATRSSELFKIQCSVVCSSPVHSMHPTTATHLYRIAQEAVTNAVKHGAAKHVEIALSSSSGKTVLTVTDDGSGAKRPVSGHTGMGVRIMNYRAETLGGTLAFRAGRRGGTSVICTVPNAAKPATKEN